MRDARFCRAARLTYIELLSVCNYFLFYCGFAKLALGLIFNLNWLFGTANKLVAVTNWLIWILPAHGDLVIPPLLGSCLLPYFYLGLLLYCN